MNKKPPFEFSKGGFLYSDVRIVFPTYPPDILSEKARSATDSHSRKELRAKNYALNRHDMPEPSGISHNKGLPIGSPLTLLGFNIELTEFVNVNR